MLASCKKNTAVIPSSPLVGKWKSVEVLNAYLNGGDFQWHSLDESSAEILQFSADGNYRVNHQNSPIIIDKGSYKMINDSTISFFSSAGQQALNIWQHVNLSAQTLIIDQQVKEGVIRDKYIPAN